ncbi:hypothetical protein GCK32_006597 [Trichostrongylus colubriformis]|uniref:IRS-type PTB domain-containing protein n=1 Tax=Trichostrongylus colubriformis TaxID=6319 RepID=A0AAN8F900_TRICO
MTSPSVNFEEDSGIIKSGPVVAGFAPIKSRKNYYAVLCERALELHESEKTYRKRKSARHLIDLSIAFNLHNEHFDPKLKRCVCLMGPDETLCLKVDDVGKECAWDVEVVNAPKLKRSPGRSEEPLQNICVRLPEIAGPKRLCFYAHTIVLCKRRIEPAICGIPSSGIPPFHTDDFIEIPRKCVAFFGCQERYFLMRLGRGAPMGASELWAQCDSEEVAHDIHNKLNAIIERESEKKKKMNNGVVMPPGLLSIRSHHGHRERSHTQPLRPRTSSFLNGRAGSSASTTSAVGRKQSTPANSTPLGSRALSVSQSQSGNTSRGSSLMSIFPIQSPSNTPREVDDVYQPMEAPTKMRSSPSTSTTDDTENSGGTICIDQSDETRSLDMSVAQMTHPVRDPKIKRQSSETMSYRQQEDLCSLGGDMGSGGLSMEAISDRNANVQYKQDEGYTPMHAAEWTAGGSNSHLIVPAYERYKLEEVRSYVSDSSDSCYSSMAANGCSNSQVAAGASANPPRAYSFAGRCNLRPAGLQSGVVENVDLRGDSSNGGLLPPQEDPRKRAFSLGSKTLFPRPFRKISQHASRQQRLSQTSASGASLASSEVSSSFGPSSSSANHLMSLNCSEKEEYTRNRSGSFGSGRSTPYNRRGGSSGTRDGTDHFVEMDFGNAIGRSGSGSVGSVDSPNRSRTSSFGCSARKDAEIFSYPAELSESGLTPSQLVLQQAKQSSLDESCDYVSTEAPDLVAVKNALAEAAHEHTHSHHLTFLSPVDPKAIDLRSSQHFETIEESTSLKSSPCSSRSSVSAHDGSMDETDGERRRQVTGDVGYTNVNTGEDSSSSYVPVCSTRADRSASNPVSDITELHPPSSVIGLPKRSSVPTLKSHDADDSGVGLNYAFVQDAEPQTTTLLSEPMNVSSSRSRSKSGIIFTHNFDATKSALDYASIKPL